MIVGADGANDVPILVRQRFDALRAATGSKRIYYSAFSPHGPLPPLATWTVADAASARAPALPGRLAAMRFYGFTAAQIDGRYRPGGMLDLEIDPKARLGAAATAAGSRSTSTTRRAKSLLRVPGFGTQAVDTDHRRRRAGALPDRRHRASAAARCAARGRSSSLPTGALCGTASTPREPARRASRRLRTQPCLCSQVAPASCSTRSLTPSRCRARTRSKDFREAAARH